MFSKVNPISNNTSLGSRIAPHIQQEKDSTLEHYARLDKLSALTSQEIKDIQKLRGYSEKDMQIILITHDNPREFFQKALEEINLKKAETLKLRKKPQRAKQQSNPKKTKHYDQTRSSINRYQSLLQRKLEKKDNKIIPQNQEEIIETPIPTTKNQKIKPTPKTKRKSIRVVSTIKENEKNQEKMALADLNDGSIEKLPDTLEQSDNTILKTSQLVTNKNNSSSQDRQSSNESSITTPVEIKTIRRHSSINARRGSNVGHPVLNFENKKEVTNTQTSPPPKSFKPEKTTENKPKTYRFEVMKATLAVRVKRKSVSSPKKSPIQETSTKEEKKPSSTPTKRVIVSALNKEQDSDEKHQENVKINKELSRTFAKKHPIISFFERRTVKEPKSHILG